MKRVQLYVGKEAKMIDLLKMIVESAPDPMRGGMTFAQAKRRFGALDKILEAHAASPQPEFIDFENAEYEVVLEVFNGSPMIAKITQDIREIGRLIENPTEPSKETQH